MEINKTIKWVSIAIETAFILTFIILCVAVGSKNKHIRSYKEKIALQEITIDSLENRCERLGNMDCISVDVICNIQQKGVVNLNQSTQIARSTALVTRDEVLAAYDSLNNANNTK